MSTSSTIDEAVASFLKDFRAKKRVSLTQVADAAKQYGADWGSAGVRRIERGEAALTIEKLIQLALALRTLGNEALTLDDLLGTAEDLVIRSKDGSEIRAPRTWLTPILEGKKITPPSRRGEIAFHRESHTFMEKYSGDGVMPDALERAGYEVVYPTGAEVRVAEKLGVKEINVSTAARALWGQSLDEESRSRTGPDASPQARGRVTRTLAEEIRQKIDDMIARAHG